MFLRYSAFAAFLMTSCFCRTLSPRAIFRSDDTGGVSLVEFTIRGVIYGKCSYDNDQGEKITVLFEERGDELKARSEMKTVLDPVSEAHLCREAAFRKRSPGKFRSEDILEPETEYELQSRFQNFQRKLESDVDYVSSLKPRFVNFIPQGIQSDSDNSDEGFFTRLFGNLSAISLGTVSVPFPVVNVPLGIRTFSVPFIVPSIQNIPIPRPFIGLNEN